jgi:hypothetical protein
MAQDTLEWRNSIKYEPKYALVCFNIKINDFPDVSFLKDCKNFVKYY